MNFEESIIYAIDNFGRNIIGEERLVNILADLSVYKAEPACRSVLSEIIRDGTSSRLFLKREIATDIEIQQAVITISTKYGFQQDIIEYVLFSTRNAFVPKEKRVALLGQQYEYIGEEDEHGLREVHVNGKCGFIDSHNKEVVPIIYDTVSSFNEGLAAVEKDRMYGYVDLTGKLVIPLSFDLAYGFASGIAKVKIGNKYGLINPFGHVILKAEYESIGYLSNGYIAIKKNNKWGFSDVSGNVVIPPRYIKIIKPFFKGFAAVDDGHRVFVIDNKDNVIRYL